MADLCFCAIAELLSIHGSAQMLKVKNFCFDGFGDCCSNQDNVWLHGILFHQRHCNERMHISHSAVVELCTEESGETLIFNMKLLYSVSLLVLIARSV